MISTPKHFRPIEPMDFQMSIRDTAKRIMENVSKNYQKDVKESKKETF